MSRAVHEEVDVRQCSHGPARALAGRDWTGVHRPRALAALGTQSLRPRPPACRARNVGVGDWAPIDPGQLGGDRRRCATELPRPVAAVALLFRPSAWRSFGATADAGRGAVGVRQPITRRMSCYRRRNFARPCASMHVGQAGALRRVCLRSEGKLRENSSKAAQAVLMQRCAP